MESESFPYQTMAFRAINYWHLKNRGKDVLNQAKSRACPAIAYGEGGSPRVKLRLSGRRNGFKFEI
jgi:hypothetical protein